MILETLSVKMLLSKGFTIVDVGEFTTAVDFYTVAPEPALEPSINVDTADFQC